MASGRTSKDPVPYLTFRLMIVTISSDFGDSTSATARQSDQFRVIGHQKPHAYFEESVNVPNLSSRGNLPSGTLKIPAILWTNLLSSFFCWIFESVFKLFHQRIRRMFLPSGACHQGTVPIPVETEPYLLATEYQDLRQGDCIWSSEGFFA